MKETLMQYFEWYLPNDSSLWRKVSKESARLAADGISAVWLPPAYKGQSGGKDVGYGVYDMYDLGEFCSKGQVETKYGTKEEYIQAVKDLQKSGLSVLGDIVFNHKMGADESENIQAQNVNPENRNENTSDLYGVKVWTKFTFPERDGKYSDFEWDAGDFTGTDYNANNNQNSLLKFEGKNWSPNVSKEQGNFDFIMGDDVDFSVPEVVEELYRWGIWYTCLSGVNGFRLDAVKSIDARFFIGWLKKMREYGNHPSFAVGEYWSGDVQILVQYLKDCGHCMTLFDVPLHFNFEKIANDPQNADIRTVFENTLTDLEPEYACAFSDNHDTQPGQALESSIADWFKPIAYALLLLNRCKYPCVFYGDYYGIEHDQQAPVPNLRDMIWIRRNLLSDGLVPYDDEDPQKLTWLAAGEHPVAVILSIGDWKETEIQDLSLANMTLADINCPEHTVTADDTGKVTLSCPQQNVSVYIRVDDCQRMKQELSQSESDPSDSTQDVSSEKKQNG